MKSRILLLIVLFVVASVNSNLFSQSNNKDFDWNEYHKKTTYLSALQFSHDGNHTLNVWFKSKTKWKPL